MDRLLAIDTDEWIRGGTPEPSHIAPWGVQSLGRDDIDYWQGRVAEPLVDEAIEALVRYVRQ